MESLLSNTHSISIVQIFKEMLVCVGWSSCLRGLIYTLWQGQKWFSRRTDKKQLKRLKCCPIVRNVPIEQNIMVRQLQCKVKCQMMRL